MTASSTIHLREELETRASVLATFEIGQLGFDPATPGLDAEIARLLLTDAEPAGSGPGDMPRFRVSEATRRAAARRGIDALRAAWNAVVERPDNTVQHWIDRLIGHGELVELMSADLKNLQGIALVSRWFEGAGPPIPSRLAIEGHLQFKRMLDPLRSVVTDYFRDRTAKLAELDRASDGQTRPILLIGRGGIGKSALVGRHLLTAVEAGRRICYLNFDHSALDPGQKAGIVGAMATQLSWQVDRRRAEHLQDIAEAAEDTVRHGDSVSTSSSKMLRIEGEGWESLLDEIDRSIGSGPLVVVFDTLEEAQRSDWDLRSLGRLIDACAARSNWSVIASGRADVVGLVAQRVTLEGLPTDDAIELLDDLLRADPTETRIELDPAQLHEVVALVTTSPLCIRLAAGILRYSSDEEEPLRDLELHQGMLEGELYRRLLGHIRDETVRTIAYPGLTLRRITPEIITEVLVRPLGLRIESADQVAALFRGLASEAMLVERVSDEELVHRSDIRPLMLDRLEKDQRTAVRKIHRSAIRYYSRRRDSASRVEELYHRLMLQQSKKTLDEHWDPEASPKLNEVATELPPTSRAYLLDKDPEFRTRFTDDEMRDVDRAGLKTVVQRRVERLVADGDVVQAIGVLQEVHGPNGESLLPVLELQVNELLGLLDDALMLAQTEELRLARIGDSRGVAELAMHRTRLLQQSGRVEDAGQHLRDVARRIDQLNPRAVDDMLRLRLVVSRLRLNRYGSHAEERLKMVESALGFFDKIRRRDLLREPHLLRDLVGELGGEAPVRVMSLALEAGALDDADGSISSSLAEFDEIVSKTRGREHGVLADLAQATGEDGSVDWKQWIDSSQSTQVASQVGSLLREFEDEMPSSIRESIADQYRTASDQANAYRV